jgi:His/Glu/Gln/Arg/opine family amino acid ABC transporter permease subunit
MQKNRVLPALTALGLYLLFFCLVLSRVADATDFSVLLDYRGQLVDAALLTLGLSLLAMVASMAVGFILFLMGNAKNLYVKYMVEIYKEIIMGTPLLVLVFVVVYVIGIAFSLSDKLVLGFMALTLYMSPYMANIFEGAYQSIDQSQFAMMDFYGFNLVQRYRYILLPQMVKPIVPGLINNLSGIVKGTSILSTIAVSEIFYTVSVVSNRTYRYIEGYFVLWMVYLLITIPLSRLAKHYSKSNGFGGGK